MSFNSCNKNNSNEFNEEEQTFTPIKVNKHDTDLCLKSFEKYFLIEKREYFDDIIGYCFEAQLEKFYIRPHAWKHMLDVIPHSFIDSVIETFLNRRRYRKMLKLTTSKKVYSGDPLGGSSFKSSSGKSNVSSDKSSTINPCWDTFHQDNDIKKIILLDINRTYQEIELFYNDKVKDSMCNVLYLWAKENPNISYKQGMNEIVAVLFLALYPYYYGNSFNSDNTIKNTKEIKENKTPNLTNLFKIYLPLKAEQSQNLSTSTSQESKQELLKIELTKLLKRNETNHEFFYFFHDENEIFSDIYYLLDKIMSRALKEFYDVTKLEKAIANNFSKDKDFVSYKQKELFQLQWKKEIINNKPDNTQLPLQRRCNEIISVKLKMLDKQLYDYFNEIDIDCTIFLQRWLKCLFNRELEWPNILILWDCIFANDLVENIHCVSEEKFDNFNMVDYISVAMIIAIKEEILFKDQNETLQKLFRYPEIENPGLIIRLAVQVKENILMKLGKKDTYKVIHKNNITTNNNSISSANNNNDKALIETSSSDMIKNNVEQIDSLLKQMSKENERSNSINNPKENIKSNIEKKEEKGSNSNDNIKENECLNTDSIKTNSHNPDTVVIPQNQKEFDYKEAYMKLKYHWNRSNINYSLDKIFTKYKYVVDYKDKIDFENTINDLKEIMKEIED